MTGIGGLEEKSTEEGALFELQLWVALALNRLNSFCLVCGVAYVRCGGHCF